MLLLLYKYGYTYSRVLARMRHKMFARIKAGFKYLVGVTDVNGAFVGSFVCVYKSHVTVL